MKLIGAALPRTGTMSFYTALNQLGLPCYHMKTLFENAAKGRGDLDMWIEVERLPTGDPRRLELLTRIFDGYDACCDAPACFVYEDLMVLFPDAKVMLTKRDAGRWRRSMAEVVYGILRLSRAPGVAVFGPANQWLYRLPVVGMLGLPGAIIPMTRQWGEPIARDGEMFYFESEAEAERIESSFERWLATVEATVPPDKLLLLERPYTDAYQTICGALNRPVPDQPWPYVNDTAQTKVAIPVFAALFYLFPLVTVGSVLALGVGLLVSSQSLLILVGVGCGLLFLLGMTRLMQTLLDNASSREKVRPG